MNTIIPWCFAFPLFTLLLSAFGLPKKAGLLSWLSPLSIFVAAAIWAAGDRAPVVVAFKDWAPFLPDSAFRLRVDTLTAVMLLVVGGVATCVFIYARAYMATDERPHRFFAFLDFFVAAMTLLVVAGNLSVLLVGWALVGVASFLLISFWWERGTPLRAGFLALGANAIGDAALLLAIVLIPRGSSELVGLQHVAAKMPGGGTTLALLLVVAACAKSAQGPLWFWLPSAMAGPTPVSALIHAATMVAAGVYLLVRTSPLLALSPDVLFGVAVVGTATAIGGGFASLWQSNFKRGLAYSTVSQLGYMFAAIGVGAPFAALFHLVTHASFKAMLFLGAGTVIHATHHEEEIGNLGGLSKKLPMVTGFFAVGTLALIGTPFFSGAYSKDSILEAALHSSTPAIGWILLGGALLTGAYAGRLFFGVFFGKEGSSSAHAHAPSFLAFDAPLLPLLLGALGLGYLEAGTHALSTFLGAAVAAPEELAVVPHLLGLGAFGLGVVGLGVGFVIARLPGKTLPAPPAAALTAILHEARAVPAGLAGLHTGRVGRYALVGLLGVVALGLLAQRRVDAALPQRVRDPFMQRADIGAPKPTPAKGAPAAPAAGTGAGAATDPHNATPETLDARRKAAERLRNAMKQNPALRRALDAPQSGAAAAPKTPPATERAP